MASLVCLKDVLKITPDKFKEHHIRKVIIYEYVIPIECVYCLVLKGAEKRGDIYFATQDMIKNGAIVKWSRRFTEDEFEYFHAGGTLRRLIPSDDLWFPVVTVFLPTTERR